MKRPTAILAGKASSKRDRLGAPATLAKRARRGFTFTETLVALLIVVLLTGFVSTAVPVAINTYRQVVGDSNAQVALSTTASALRDELGLATEVKTSSAGVVFYRAGDGTWATIDNGTAGSRGLVKHVYADSGSFDPNSPGAETSAVSLIPEAAIAGAQGGDAVRVRMTGSPYITYANGVFTVGGIEALVGGDALESLSGFKVKAALAP